MIVGVGIDILELKRLEKNINRQNGFPRKILTNQELEIFRNLTDRRQLEFLGGRFSAKEAYSKAYGTGIGKISFQDIEIIHDDTGKPLVTSHPHVKAEAWVSISHSADYVVAQVILEE